MNTPTSNQTPEQPAATAGRTDIGVGCSGGLGSVVRFQLEGQRKQDPRRWDEIAPAQADEESARAEEAEYREYMENEKTGWLDFRVVRVTTTREILPNAKAQP